MDAVYTDFRKAFDSVNYAILIDKLRAVGISGDLLEWLASFISNRSQRVKINNTYSRNIAVSLGVPQESHLGPLLFNVL